MNEQIQQTHRGQFNVDGSVQVRTGDAPTSAERKPLVSWAALLDEAVKKPGFIHEAYSRFHNYSLGNQLLALFQCMMRRIQPGPLAIFSHVPETIFPLLTPFLTLLLRLRTPDFGRSF